MTVFSEDLMFMFDNNFLTNAQPYKNYDEEIQPNNGLKIESKLMKISNDILTECKYKGINTSNKMRQMIEMVDLEKENESLKDENKMLNTCKYKLYARIDELNLMLHTSQSEHREIEQLYDASNKTNKFLQEILLNIGKEKLDLQQQIALIKHENEQIDKHRKHIKEECIRYKERYKTVCKELNLVRKKTVVLDELLRLSEHQINELEFDNKSFHIDEKILTDSIKNINTTNDDLLYKLYDKLMTNQTNKSTFHYNNNNNNNNEINNDFKERIKDLKYECKHYLKILHLNDKNNMHLKQETLFSTNQILEYWHKIFDKLSSIINIKSYTIEILHKNVLEIIEFHKNTKNIHLLNKLNDMSETIRKLESKHHKEKIELKGLLDREINLAHSQRDCMEKELHVYRGKLQTFYKKYQRKNQEKEHQELANFMDNVRYEMSQLTQENVTMATVTNSLREIVRSEQDKTDKLETQNESMYTDIYELCQYMEQISGERFLSQDEENMYNASNLSQMVCAVKEKAASISSSRAISVCSSRSRSRSLSVSSLNLHQEHQDNV